MYTYFFKGRQKYVSMSKAIFKRTHSIIVNTQCVFQPTIHLQPLIILQLLHKYAFSVCTISLSRKKHIMMTNSSILPSPSSTTAWITMGNTPRSRSKFNFKRKKVHIFYDSMRRCCNTLFRHTSGKSVLSNQR